MYDIVDRINIFVTEKKLYNFSKTLAKKYNWINLWISLLTIFKEKLKLNGVY